jgi:hypothetical protein
MARVQQSKPNKLGEDESCLMFLEHGHPLVVGRDDGIREIWDKQRETLKDTMTYGFKAFRTTSVNLLSKVADNAILEKYHMAQGLNDVLFRHYRNSDYAKLFTAQKKLWYETLAPTVYTAV